MNKRAPRLLVVEDDEDVREMLATILEAAGFVIDLAAHGREALERIDEVEPDVVLLDMRMPVMNGWQLARALDERGSRPPIIVVTAAADPAAWAREIAADGWLAKPFDLEEAEALIGRVLENARNRKSQARA